MAIILNIDTAIDTASVCLAKDTEVLSIIKNENQKDHAAWLHVAVKEIFEKNALELTMIDATAVMGGPGSYTGLRIGMATVKGICYALARPMIVLNTLQVMANAAKNENADLLCPMIDARRMEVFTAMYSKDLKTIKEPAAITLNEKSFDEELTEGSICFFGNGSDKFRAIKKNENAFFSLVVTDASHMVSLSQDKFMRKEFADLAYAEPLYLKEFYTPAR